MSMPPVNVPQIPGVRLTGVLGHGGFAVVYAGEQLSLQRPVAVKVDSRPLHEERNRRRFLREMRAASQISSHPHVVTLIDTGVLPDGRPYLVMERCDGGSLSDVVARGPLPAADAVRLIQSTASALGAAHSAGVLHRDIKPGNILLDTYGTPRLSDFGIAAIQQAEAAPTVTLEALTPAYAPPEAFNQVEPTAAGDVWSLGAVLFALLTGRGPRSTWDGKAQNLTQIFQELNLPVTTNDPRIPGVLRPLLDRAMHLDPTQRFHDGHELARALGSILPRLDAHPGDPEATSYRPPQFSEQPTIHAAAPVPAHATPATATLPAVRKRRTTTIVVGLVAATVLVGAAIWGTITLVGGPALTLPPRQSPQPTTHNTRTPSDPNFARALDANAVPTSSDMPWPVGSCLVGRVDSAGGHSAAEVDCADANWRVFAGGTIDSTVKARNSTEALGRDPQVAEACTDDNAKRAGLDVSGPHTLRALGSSQKDWEAGKRGFSCVFATN
ncbi:MAG: serine/threonine-protein kinase [Propionibacteriaceae bacterium]|nr:serine/threonine-protein kinase [Propionibacteriaceae bacterium]